jgi:[ribosomal protein S18]-alanine N-acetyltransferase
MSALLKNIPKFRPMYGVDIDTIIGIENTLYPYPWTRGNFTDSLGAGYQCRVAECAGEIAAYGVLMIGVKEAHLLNLSVATPWQRRGIGSEMLRQFIRLAQEGDADTILLEVRPSNIVARELYKRAGFSDLTVRRNYYPATDGKEDAILMGLVI